MRIAALLLSLSLGSGVSACHSAGGVTQPDPDTGGDAAVRIPLTEMKVADRYLGYEGGLYPGVSNQPPAAHRDAGLVRARAVQPLDTAGRPNPAGTIVLLSIGMSNTTQEFCSARWRGPCESWSFVGQAEREGGLNPRLALVNGANGGQTAPLWAAPKSPNYDRVRDEALRPQGLSEAQVQVVWLKVADARPTVFLPAAEADAFQLLRSMGEVARALRARYPNLKQVFVSSRIYGGYASTELNPEPYAYESGFAVRWLVQAQIEQMRQGTRDPRAGNLAYDAVPWLAWGPYLWADGEHPRSDGLLWRRDDLEADGTHPSRLGEEKVGRLLLDFFRTSSFTHCWFTGDGTCG